MTSLHQGVPVIRSAQSIQVICDKQLIDKGFQFIHQITAIYFYWLITLFELQDLLFEPGHGCWFVLLVELNDLLQRLHFGIGSCEVFV